jgi:hypothetical protein
MAPMVSLKRSMNFRGFAPLLLLTVSCGTESKCDETFSCRAAQGAVNSGNGNSDLLDSGVLGDASGGTRGGGSGTGSGASNNNGSGGNIGNGGAGDDDGNAGASGLGDGGNIVLCGTTFGTGCTPSQQGAVFVDAAAPEGGDGSLNSPLSSITEAVTLAKEQDATDIYICAGTYDENVLITDDEAGIDLHGGYQCAGFTYDATAVPLIQPANGGYALHVDALQSSILIEAIAFAALDATKPGESSIAVFIRESADVTFQKCQFSAGDGVDGAHGVTANFVEGTTVGVHWPELSLLDGNDGTSTLGGAATPQFICPGTAEFTWGGKGGDTTAGALDGENGGPASRGGAGQTAGPCNPGGENGTAGSPGSDGEPAAAGGVLTASGFLPNAGENGSVGEVGGGGGGGGGAEGTGVLAGGGGGGGAGGCGGNFGPGGQGGGASIALLVYESTVVLRASSLISGNGGWGGAGAAGQTGQEGGWSGLANPRGCPGGLGADGGDGGNGGGGAGGISVGLLWSGATAPTLDQATTDAVTVGLAGKEGPGESIDSYSAPGFAAAVHQL